MKYLLAVIFFVTVVVYVFAFCLCQVAGEDPPEYLEDLFGEDNDN